MDVSDRLSALRRELQTQLGEDRFELWIGSHVQIDYRENALRVSCGSKIEMDWLRRRLSNTLQSSCRQVFGGGVAVVFEVQANLATDSERTRVGVEQSQPTAQPTLFEPTSGTQQPPRATQTSTQPNLSAQLNASPRPKRSPRHCFANFVPGTCNQLALGTVKSVVQEPGRYSPLLVYGTHGTGKTHLLDAAAVQMRRLHPGRQILRITAEQFTAEFMDALNKRATTGFRGKYRSVEVLLIDDIHFLAGKKTTLEEFAHTLETLIARGGQAILSSCVPPDVLQAMHPGIASRIAGGMAAPLELPDCETRVGIVRTMATRMKLTLPEDVMQLVAQRASGSARLLSGALNRLVATSTAMKKPITTILADLVVTEFCQQHTPQVGLTDIQRAVCKVFGMEAATLKSSAKSRAIVQPRQLAMWLACRYSRAGLAEIGEFFGRRSHSTVHAAQKKCDQMVSDNINVHLAHGQCSMEEAIRRVEAEMRA